MSEDSQIVVPPAFIALYTPAGKLKPTLSREALLERHEFCDDLAQMLTGQAQMLQARLGVTEADVLERIQRGLLDPSAGLQGAEAGWVVGRLAELLDWPLPAPAEPPPTEA